MDANPETLSDMFRSFHSLLVKIRDLLRILNVHELHRVEKALCTGETQLKFGEHEHSFCSRNSFEKANIHKRQEMKK